MVAQLVKPTTSNGNGFLGLQGARITNIEDLSAEFDWADVCLNVELELERSKYPADLRIAGKFEYTEGLDTIEVNSLIRKIDWFAQTIGWKGGIDIHGQFCLNDGTVVDNIAAYLNDHFVPSFEEQAIMVADEEYPYLVYLYKKWSARDRRAYTRVVPRIVHNTDSGKQELEGYVRYLKQNGYLEEYVEERSPAARSDVVQPAEAADVLTL